MIGIQTRGKPRGGNLKTRALDTVRVLSLNERMKIGHEKETLYVFFMACLNCWSDCTDIIADVQSTCSVDAC